MRQDPLAPGDTAARESALRGVATSPARALGIDEEMGTRRRCAHPGNALSQPPVLKHGPRSACRLRVEGSVHLEA